jgi:hypothetical protein
MRQCAEVVILKSDCIMKALTFMSSWFSWLINGLAVIGSFDGLLEGDGNLEGEAK